MQKDFINVNSSGNIGLKVQMDFFFIVSGMLQSTVMNYLHKLLLKLYMVAIIMFRTFTVLPFENRILEVSTTHVSTGIKILKIGSEY